MRGVLDLCHYFCFNIMSYSKPLKTHNSKSTEPIEMIQKLICFVELSQRGYTSSSFGDIKI